MAEIKKKQFRFEIGTPNYHGIDLLRYGFRDIERYGGYSSINRCLNNQSLGGMKAIQSHSFNLAAMAKSFLVKIKHANGNHIAVIYGWESTSEEKQGPIVTFNLKRDDGSFVGYVEVSYQEKTKS